MHRSPRLAILIAATATPGLPASGVGFSFVPLPEIAFPNNHFPTHVRAADLDGDGDLDLVIPGRDTDGLVYLLFNNGDGTFAAPVPLNVGGQTDWVQIGDVDGDGLDDLAFAYRSRPSGLAIMRGMGGGAFHPIEHFTGGREVRSIALRDFDGDGDLDAVGVDYLGFQAIVWTNDGSGAFSVTSTERLNEDAFALVYPNSIEAGDLDGDGFDDVVITAIGGNRVNVLINRRDGTFKPEVGYRPPVTQSVLPALTNSALGDMDGDGDLDIVSPWIMGFLSQRIGVLLNASAGGAPGTFNSSVNFPSALSGISWWAALGDFDGDGDLDVACGYGLPGTFGLMMNVKFEGQFQLLQLPTEELGQFVRSILPADLDGDGDLDLVLLEAPSNRVLVLRNDTPQGGGGGGESGFGGADGGVAGNAAPTPGTPAIPGIPALGDRNHDGLVDAHDLALELAERGSEPRPPAAPPPVERQPGREPGRERDAASPNRQGGAR